MARDVAACNSTIECRSGGGTRCGTACLSLLVARGSALATILLALVTAVALPARAASASGLTDPLPDGAILRIGQAEADGDAKPGEFEPASIRGVAFSADGRLLATRDEPGDPAVPRAVRLWNAATGRPLAVLTGHKGPIADFAISPDGRTIVSTEDGGSDTGFTRVWDVATGASRHVVPEGGPVVEFAPDGATFSLVVRDQIRVYRTATGEEVQRFPGPNVTHDLSRDGRLTLARSFERDPVLRLFNVQAGRERAKFELFSAASRAVVLSPQMRAIAASEGRSIVLCEVETGAMIYRLDGHAQPVFAVAFSPDGRLVASGGLDRSVRLWEVATGQELHRFEGHEGVVTALVFSQDGNRLVSGSTDRTAIVWDLAGRVDASIPAQPVDPRTIDDLWHDLAAPEPDRAYRAIGRIAAAQETALPRLHEKLITELVPDQNQRIERLLRDLSHHDSRVRHRATRELRKLRQIARPLLDRLLAQTDSPEVRNRVLRILGGSQDTPRFTPGDERRMIRILAALEEIGGPDAENAVELIIREFPPERVNRDARATLDRMRSG